jgi:hypothetical protein
MKIKVIIEERICKEMEIEAVNMEEAMWIAEDLYYKGEFAPDIPDEVNCKLMYANDGEYDTEWVEF